MVNDSESVNFGSRIREIRKASGMTLEVLAEKSGVSRAALSKIERCERNPGLEIAVRIADALGTNLAQVLGGSAPGASELVRGLQPSIVDQATGVRRESLFPGLAGVEIVRFTFPAHTSAGPFSSHGARSHEVFVVLEGRITVETAQGGIHLGRHDVASISGDQDHSLHNRSSDEASIIIFILRS
ncbi:helix-turn-helix domain-containing protein [Nocardia testacea]|uniref:helix-turn-helix domain-containing protein n=1 Tax=Nocardia testacea TaxID=248551 RepID=UPI0033F6CA3C